MNNLKIGMKVLCDLHQWSKVHILTGLREKQGFAEIDNQFFWPIYSVFPYDKYKHLISHGNIKSI